MRIEWTKLAQADLKHIHAYIRQDSPPAAVSVLASIRRAVRGQLSVSPLSGHVGRVEATRELVVPRLPYVVAYRLTGTSVQILRVLHGAQRWPKGF
jgi:toxin ParE1/3/4